jgi:multidrug efflux pump subunit AcrA (membrane-fusion protein)
VLVADTRPDAVVVPASSVVKRPAGEVIYRLDSRQAQQARQVVVKTGVRNNGWVEITEGIRAGDIVVVEGASYLTEGAKVKVQEIAQ